MNREERVGEILLILKNEFPQADTALNHRSVLELLIATILSAQCTDERVNQVTEELFKKYLTVADYANADLGTLEQDVKSTGFYRNKAGNIKKCCRRLIERFNGRVPGTMKELVTLPGVGRKTANIVLGHGYGITEGIAVDTHVLRLSKRLGLTDSKNSDRVERDLMKITPREDWTLLTDLLILHGRKTCSARKPGCRMCSLNKICPGST